MEISHQSLATDSFSYSWLTTTTTTATAKNPSSFDTLLQSLSTKNDDIDIESSFRFSINLANADDIFSGGCTKPVSPGKSAPATPEYDYSPSPAAEAAAYSGPNCSSRKCRKSGALLQWCYGLVIRPICRGLGLGCSRKSVRVDDLDRKVMEVRRRSSSVPPSPERRNWAATAGLRKSRSSACERLLVNPRPTPPRASPARSPARCGSSSSTSDDASIDEAILHCKRSFGVGGAV